MFFKKLQDHKFIINLLAFIASVIIGYVCYWFITMDLIDTLYNLNSTIKAIFLIICHAEAFYLLFKFMFKLEIYKFEKIILIISYLVLMLLMFFDRVHIGIRVYNLNVLDILDTIRYSGVSSTLLNILIFCPFYTVIKWINKDFTYKDIVIIFLIFSIGVEVIQFITMSGIFDIVDIILYMVGFLIGSKIYKIMPILHIQ